MRSASALRCKIGIKNELKLVLVPSASHGTGKQNKNINSIENELLDLRSAYRLMLDRAVASRSSSQRREQSAVQHGFLMQSRYANFVVLAERYDEAVT